VRDTHAVFIASFVVAFDSGIDRLHPFFRRPNILPVHPRLSPAPAQRLVQPAHELLIFARTRDEDLLWPRQLLIAGRCWHEITPLSMRTTLKFAVSRRKAGEALGLGAPTELDAITIFQIRR
jgi:hypothetical protein